RVAREPQAAPEADHVRIERHDQLRRRNRPPDAEIHLIAAHHPPQEQVQPLAAAARGRPRKKVADTVAFRPTPVYRAQIQRKRPAREAVEAVADVDGIGSVALEEERLDRSVTIEHLAEHPQQRGDIDPARPAVHHRAQLRVRRRGIEATDERRGFRTEDVRQRLDRVEDAGDAPECERRRAKAHDLLILRPGVPPDNLDGVRRRAFAVIRLVQLLETGTQRSGTRDAGRGTRILGLLLRLPHQSTPPARKRTPRPAPRTPRPAPRTPRPAARTPRPAFRTPRPAFPPPTC